MAITDTTPDIERMVAARHAAMTSLERFEIAIIESSLPPDLTRAERRYAIAKRMYGDELPEAALIAHANWQEPSAGT